MRSRRLAIQRYLRAAREASQKDASKKISCLYPWQHQIAQLVLLERAVQRGEPVRYLAAGIDSDFFSGEILSVFRKLASKDGEARIIVWDEQEQGGQYERRLVGLCRNFSRFNLAFSGTKNKREKISYTLTVGNKSYYYTLSQKDKDRLSSHFPKTKYAGAFDFNDIKSTEILTKGFDEMWKGFSDVPGLLVAQL